MSTTVRATIEFLTPVEARSKVTATQISGVLACNVDALDGIHLVLLPTDGSSACGKSGERAENYRRDVFQVFALKRTGSHRPQLQLGAHFPGNIGCFSAVAIDICTVRFQLKRGGGGLRQSIPDIQRGRPIPPGPSLQSECSRSPKETPRRVGAYSRTGVPLATVSLFLWITDYYHISFDLRGNRWRTPFTQTYAWSDNRTNELTLRSTESIINKWYDPHLGISLERA